MSQFSFLVLLHMQIPVPKQLSPCLQGSCPGPQKKKVTITYRTNTNIDSDINWYQQKIGMFLSPLFQKVIPLLPKSHPSSQQ